MPEKAICDIKIAVLGGGSFGTALANIIAQNAYTSVLWVRNQARCEEIQKTRINSHYLPGYTLAQNLLASTDLAQCVKGADVVVMAVPGHSFRSVTIEVAPLLDKESLLISATKGIDPDRFLLMSDILKQEAPGHDIGVLSGPNFAKEIIQNHLTASVIASESSCIRKKVPKIFSSSTFRVYASEDRYGVELAGALKNIYAIVSGMASALGCGNNTQAMILTRSLAEMGRFLNKLGANAMTLLGLAGVGDLSLTCSSDLSRNYRVGYAVGKGQTLDCAMRDIGQAVEGVNTLRLVKDKADELDIYMPLAQGLYRVLFEGKEIKTIVKELMSGEVSKDVEHT